MEHEGAHVPEGRNERALDREGPETPARGGRRGTRHRVLVGATGAALVAGAAAGGYGIAAAAT
ncbi:MAG: hypothetical protein M0Z33_13510, partial [Actinomycetota bacterium]|nr:hypothetical protein [Actinomycetota bacterium]